ncbi:MAG TPA: nucleoside transporter C-terminal domain-containing protein [Verrucomicrobiae bacterium]|nr:nucleoside transporter C-terminal domain-containing protein [Verrucomicrobiae bacterium]
MQLKLVSVFGMCVMIGVAWVFSNNRKLFPWRTVVAGLALQFAFALFILKTPWGAGIFNFLQHVVDKLGDFALEGAKMVFGQFADKDALVKVLGPGTSVMFAIIVASTIILISTLSAFFYHYGILQRVVHAMALVMKKFMRTSGSESLAAAANIFMGQTEAALVVKPYLANMTSSEVMALMTTGMATIASGVMVVYVEMGVSAGHILTASVMSAPAALLIAKIMFPETAHSETAADASAKVEIATVNGIDALCRGASEGMNLAINVIAMLIAFVAMVAFVNFTLGWLQHKCGVANPVTLQNLLGWINAPFAWLMGVPAKDCVAFGQILGERIVLNEFIGYLDLTNLVKANKDALDPRTVTLATYALCGFANFSSIAIQIGGIGALAPNRRGDLARLGFRSMVGGLLASYLTATIAGILI